MIQHDTQDHNYYGNSPSNKAVFDEGLFDVRSVFPGVFHYEIKLYQKSSKLQHNQLQLSYDPRSHERSLCNCVYRSQKIQDLNGVWTHDIVTPVRGSNQLSYEATDCVAIA